MKLITHAKGTQSLGLRRIVLAVIVGLAIVAIATGSQKPLGEQSLGGFERLKQVPVDAAVERVDRNHPAHSFEPAADASSDYPDGERSLDQVDGPRPSPADIWIDVRLLEAVSRVV
jgi:hypothetical protein